MESHKSVSHSIKAAWESVCGVRERNSGGYVTPEGGRPFC